MTFHFLPPGEKELKSYARKSLHEDVMKVLPVKHLFEELPVIE